MTTGGASPLWMVLSVARLVGLGSVQKQGEQYTMCKPGYCTPVCSLHQLYTLGIPLAMGWLP